MQSRYSRHASPLIAAVLALTLPATNAASAQKSARAAHDWSAVDQALGRHGALQPGDVIKYGFPRSDLQVSVDGVQLRPAFALGSWVAFRSAGRAQAMAMGDLVLTEDEVGPVMRALEQRGVEVTAVHNHLQHESPRVMYVHIAARGNAAQVAGAIHAALGESRTPLGAPAAPTAAAPIDLDTAALARTLGVAGKVNGGVYQVSVPRRVRVTDHGMEVPPSMGVATGINFQPTGGGNAAVTGDFVLIASEVNPVIRALQQHGIAVTALHSHMLTESPRLFFMHFWANADATALATGLRAALDQMAVKRAVR